MASRTTVAVPQTFLVPAPRPPSPPPMPGTVGPEDVRPPVDPPRRLLRPWAPHHHAPRCMAATLPAELDPALLEAFLKRHDVEGTVACVFKDRPDLVPQVMASLQDPFRGTEGCDVVWTLHPAVLPNPTMEDRLGGKKMKLRHKILRGPPWSIISYADAGTGVIKRNMVYDGEGDAVAQVDFGHSFGIGIHVHALVQGNLEHTPGSSDDHCFLLHAVPWPWVCVPDRRHWKALGDADADGPERYVLPALSDTEGWCSVSVPYEDYSGMGSQQPSDL